MGEAWRLLRHGAAPGPWNMGVDEALLRSAEQGRASLRFYRWRGPWLSLGYAQRADPERLVACRQAGVGVLRRMTGGRAVLHDGDLTYAVAAPLGGLPGGLDESYAWIAAALVAGLRSLGLDARPSPRSDPAQIRSPAQGPARSSAGGAFDCFARPAGHEILVGECKLVGSAQRRSALALLQHGSVRLRAPAPEVARAAGVAPGPGLAELGCSAAPERVQQVLEAAFGELLGIVLEAGALSPEEQQAARQRSPECRESPSSGPPAAGS